MEENKDDANYFGKGLGFLKLTSYEILFGGVI